MTADPGLVAWQCLGTSIVHTAPLFDVRCDSIVGPGGERETVAYAVSPGSVTVLAVDDDDTVVLTRKWIYVNGGTEWRLPGGSVPAGDTDYPAVARRMLLATGLRADDLTCIGVVHEADSVCAHADHVFLATGLSRGDVTPVEQVRGLPFREAVKLVLDGHLPHAGSSYAVLVTAVRRAAQGRHWTP